MAELSPKQSERFALICVVVSLGLIARTVFLRGGARYLSPANSSSSFRGVLSKSGNEREVIFYNVFVPPSSGDDDSSNALENVLSIVKEQMDQVDDSKYARDLSVRYGLIGGDASASEQIEELCRGRKNDGGPRRNCTRVAHEEKGNEWVTLQPLYEYCLANPDKWVTYLHNKGSFHPSPENGVMRRMITKAALSDECQTVRSDMCNVCSNRYTPLPFLHTSGNHWTASCEYVGLLIPPLYFYPAMEEVMDKKVEGQVLSWVNNGNGWKDEGYDDRAGAGGGREADTVSLKSLGLPTIYTSETFQGRGRFAMEHWIHSHPRQRPCDVNPGKYAWGHDDLPPPPGDGWMPDLRPAPRFETLERYVIPPFAEAANDPWFCGVESKLYEFGKLYGEWPPEDSWVWTFYEASKGFCNARGAGKVG